MRKKYRESENRLILILSVFAIVITATLIFVAAQSTNNVQRQENKTEVKPLKIETPEPCDTGGIVVYTHDGGVYAFYGTFVIYNDGRNGKEVEITMDGYMEANYPHGVPEIKEQYEP